MCRLNDSMDRAYTHTHAYARAMCSYIPFCVQSQSESGKLNQDDTDTVPLNQIDGWLYTFFM